MKKPPSMPIQDSAHQDADAPKIAIEVAYALPNQQKIISLVVEPGTTAYKAVRHSGIDLYFTGLDLNNVELGIFGQAFGTKGLGNAQEYVMQPGDRIEIYRPLTTAPKEARQRRAARNKAGVDKRLGDSNSESCI